MDKYLLEQKLKSVKINENMNILYYMSIFISFGFFILSNFSIFFSIFFIILDLILFLIYKFLKNDIIKKEFLINGITLSLNSFKLLLLSFMLLNNAKLINLINVLIYISIYLLSYFLFYKMIFKEKKEKKEKKKRKLELIITYSGIIGVIIYRFVDKNFSSNGISILISLTCLFLSCIANFSIWFYLYYYWIKKFEINKEDLLNDEN